MNYVDCWIRVATDLFAQALVGEPQLVDSLPKPLSPGSFGWAATVNGDESGRFAVVIDGSILEAPLLGDGPGQKDSWGELLRETFDAAAGDLLAKTGKKCRVDIIEPIEGESKVSHTFQLKAGDRAWTVLVKDDVRVPKPAPAPPVEAAKPAAAAPPPPPPPPASHPPAHATAAPVLSPGLELLLDVELEASLRFGCRELPLSDILNLGPGDVVQLDRHVSDPVDLVVGDKIVARGDVVLVNGNFGLRITEVAEPRKRLEGIRCLF
jgi:flagellar motor switch protein FliN